MSIVSPLTGASLPDQPSSSATGKENTPLRQSTLLAIMDKGKNKKKSTLTLDNGARLDVISPITPQVLEAMRTRIIELEDEIAQQPPTKRARTSIVPETTAEASTASAGPSAASLKAEEKKRKMQVKKVFDRLKKECKSDVVKFQGSAKTIKFDEVYTVNEFDSLFAGKGVLFQPTPQNKPKSVVTIIQFNTADQIQSFFGAELKPLKGNIWTRGGVPARTFGGGFGFGFGGGGSTFTKSQKVGAVDVTIRSLEVNYSKNNMKCTLKFEIGQIGGGSSNYYGDEDSDY
ncbi:hypothetical protein DXG01_002056 [Tephrocybe rancida]|nr:hypothetical protein DXG01_002056 [Tephrocybe rancida]